MNKKDIRVNQLENEDFLKSALTLRGSITPKIIYKVLTAVLYAGLVCILNYYFPHITLPIGPFEYGGFIMGLLLVFRINAGYDRWWEARKLWGTIINLSRNFAIIVTSYTNPKHLEWEKRIRNYISILPYFIRNRLRSYRDISAFRGLIDEEQYDTLIKSENQALVLSHIIAHELNSARIESRLSDFAFMQAETKRSELLDALGACERILKTPIPYVMAIKTRLYILLFMLPLPFALVDLSLQITPIITGLVAYALLALDQIGIELQNPFSPQSLSHLPLTELCKGIESGVKEI